MDGVIDLEKSASGSENSLFSQTNKTPRFFSYSQLILQKSPSVENNNPSSFDPLISSQPPKREDEPSCLNYEEPIYNSVDDLATLVHNCLEEGVPPERIEQGSSGSYFVFDRDQKKIGVFKPNDEEPYGHLNPKWIKWAHKTCLPCCFGRSCIIPQQGYLSEVGASVVDNFLNFNIVPKTTIAWLRSPVFNYSKIDRANAKTRKIIAENIHTKLTRRLKQGLRYKVGSLQTFVDNYSDAYLMIQRFPFDFIESNIGGDFLFKFQKLVILDYLIRNTDRGNDNWLIKVSHVTESADSCIEFPKNGAIEIAAIDNGLAFPFKHPDSWRSYPYHWSILSFSDHRFLPELAKHTLLLLKNDLRFNDLIHQLRMLFSTSESFSESLFNDQMAVMRGQALNIIRALEENLSPKDLVQMTPVYVRPLNFEDENESSTVIHTRNPFFSCF